MWNVFYFRKILIKIVIIKWNSNCKTICKFIKNSLGRPSYLSEVFMANHYEKKINI
jgi:hypothetical protein